MSERNFWSLIRPNLGIKMYRVENKVAAGMPDIHYVSESGSGWIELKYIPGFQIKGRTKIGIRKAQAIWHRNYRKNGGISWILLRVGREKIFLFSGEHAEEISKMPSDKEVVVMSCWSFFGNLKKEDWEDLKSVILEPHRFNSALFDYEKLPS
jgi:hypothetical protein